jgi:hypothetical protein
VTTRTATPVTRTTRTAARAGDQPGVRFALANAALVTVLFVAAAARLDRLAAELTALVTAVVAAAGLAVLLRATIGVVMWALVTGFVQNSLGQLTFHRGDLGRLALFVVVVCACHRPAAAASSALRRSWQRAGGRL